jgi:hypothetical protein
MRGQTVEASTTLNRVASRMVTGRLAAAYFRCVLQVCLVQDSSVGTATRYGQDGPRIESRWCEIFRTRTDRPWGPNPASWTMGTGSSRGKTAGAWRCPSTPSSAEVKERVELYLCSPSRPSRPLLRRTLPFLYHYVLPNALCKCQLNSVACVLVLRQASVNAAVTHGFAYNCVIC